MQKTSRHANYDLYKDFRNIKMALGDAAYDAFANMKGNIRDGVESVKDTKDVFEENITHYVHEKPFKSLGIAILAGMAIGYFFRK